MGFWVALLTGVTSGPSLPPVSALLDCARDADITLVAAHRAGGFAPGIPENSLAGIRAAAALGAAFAEVDLRETADGEIVLMHDETLDRTTTGRGRVGHHTLAELRRVQLVNPHGRPTSETVPTLNEALAVAQAEGIYLELDLKGVEAHGIARQLRENGHADETILILYNTSPAAAIQAIAPNLGLSLPLTDRDDVLNSELDFSTLVSWVGHGVPNARTEALLTGQGIETAMHDFPGERDGTIDYAFIDAMHVELLASDNPQAAVAVLGDWRPVCGR
ncbi:glycerophosphodiester phosphodiesterase family protein [Hyphobacterium sp.]|uniref:glycerophosphodiester phosphodiesterase family protein n=1 Tax=Hyphobacterium sp. TaxID=2004662 RepID=UPI003B515739